MAERIEELENLATNMVGDGKTPDLFFVSDEGCQILITTEFPVAYEKWQELADRYPLQESALENRTIGVICSVEPEEEGSTRLEVRDDTGMFRVELGL